MLEEAGEGCADGRCRELSVHVADDPVCEVGNQMHEIQDHHACRIGSETDFEVDGGFLHLIVILTDHLDDWIGDQTGEQPWRGVRLRCQPIRAFLLCSSDDGNRPVIVTDWRAWTLMCFIQGQETSLPEDGSIRLQQTHTAA